MHACVGEGYGNPLQCSCLENPRDRGAWWAAIYGVAQSRTRLTRLSSSSSSSLLLSFTLCKMGMMVKIAPTSRSFPSGCRPSWLDGYPFTGHRTRGGREGHLKAEAHTISSPFQQKPPLSACMPPGTGSSPPKFSLVLPGGWLLHSGESCPLWTSLGQVATGPALQQDDLMVQGAETQNYIKLLPHMGLPSWHRW